MTGWLLKHRRIIPWIILICYWIILCVLTHIPRFPSDMAVHVSDKLIHYLAFLGLTLLFWLAEFGSQRPSLRHRMVWITGLMLALYGVADELTQHFVNRTVSFTDWLSDFGGVVTGIFMVFVMRRWIYWLIVYGIGLFCFTHWPDPQGPIKLPPYLAQFELVYYMAGYVALTILFWRSICPRPRFMTNWGIFVTSVIILPLYGLLDQGVSVLQQRGFDGMEFTAGMLGIALGMGCAFMLARHNDLMEQDYSLLDDGSGESGAA